MPLYEYECYECKVRMEAWRDIVDRDDAPYHLCKGCKCGCCGIIFRVLTAPHLHGSPNMPND